MSALLRSIGIVRSLKNFAETSVCLRALKPCSTNIASKNFHIQSARFFAVQHKSLRRTERDGYTSKLSNVLERLNTDGRQLGCISFDLFQDAVFHIKQTNSVSSSQALVVLRCCGSIMPEELPSARTELAHSLWQIFENRGLPLDLSHYNALLRIYIENEHGFSPSEFLERLKCKHIEPNRVTYQRLIMRYAQLGDIEGATSILEVMKERNLPINDNIFHALILGHSRAGDLKNAEDMLTVMQESGIEPSVDTYLALAVAQAEQGDINGLKSTITLSADKDEALHDRDLMEIIYSLASKGHADHVPEIIKLLKKEWGYNQDCKNLMYRLLNAGCDDTARLMYSTMDPLSDSHSESSINQGLFYVKHLIAKDKPLSSILSLCEDVSGNDVHLLQRSLEVALTRNPKLVYPLMDAIQTKGANLRPHFFWPMLARCADTNDINGVFDILQNMNTRGVPITMLTLLDFVLPIILRDSSTQISDVITKLGRVGLSLGDAGSSIARYFMRKGDLASALQLLQHYRFRIAPNARRDLAIATVRTKDYWSSAALLSEIRVGREPDRLPQENEDSAESLPGELQSNEEPVAQDVEDVVGRFLLDISQRSGSASEDFDWVALLTALKERGLSISKKREASLSYALGRRATSEVNTLLSCLASGTLKKVQLERRPQFLSYNKMSVEQLEEAVENCTESGRDPKPMLTNLLIAYCNADELEKANNVLKMLEETHQFPVGVGLRVHLINLYHKTNQPQLAFDMLEKIWEIEPDALLKSKAILKIANLYVDADRIEDAAVFLETEAKKRHASGEINPAPEGKDHGIDLLCNRILTPSSESGDVEMVSRLERAILDGQFAAPSRRLFNPIVRAYLVKGDLDAAWASVVECKSNYNIIPFRKSLARELIKREDTNKLQQLVDMATDLYGEHNSLFDLACFFVDEERVKEAKRVLETPGLRVRSESVSEICKYYLREKQTKRIEDLLAASAGTSIDRRFVYEYLLEAYINDGNCDKALGLWTQMQEEDLPASDKFLRDLGSFLQQNDKPVPFAIPEEENVSQRAQLQPQQETKKAPELQQPRHPKLLEYEKLLEDGKLDEALSLHTELLSAEDEDLVVKPRHSFTLAKKLLDVGRLDDTIKIFQESPAMRKRNSGLLRTIAKRLAELNDYDRFEDFFTNYRSQDDGYLAVQLCKTAGRSNQAERCFNTIEKILNEVSSDTKRFSHLFPSSGLLWLVKKDPSLMTRLETLSDKMKSKGVVKGIETLWGYHFIEGNTEEAKKLSEEVKDGNAFDLCVPVLHYCRETQDVLVAQNLLSYIKENLANSDTAVAATYNCIIDILCQKNKPREALKTLEESQKSINLKSINAATLKTLSEQLAAENIKFPFEIPAATTLRPGVSHRK